MLRPIIDHKSTRHFDKMARSFAEEPWHLRTQILVPRNWVDSSKEFLKVWYTKMGYILQSTEDFGRLYPEKSADLATTCDFAIYHKILEK